MKKLLISLIIIMNLIFIPVFADDITVADTAQQAYNLTQDSLFGFGESFERVYNYLVNNNYINENSKYILFPAEVVHNYNGVNNNIIIRYQLMISSSPLVNDKFVVISHTNTLNVPEGHQDFWVGYTGSWSVINGILITDEYNYSNASQVGSISVSDNTSDCQRRWGNRWQTNFSFNTGGTIYLLVSDFHNVAQFGGLYYSVYSSQSLLPTYLGSYVTGFSSGTWDDWYTLNDNYVINVFRSNGVNVSNINTNVYVSDNTITFDNGVNNNELIDLNVNSLWGTLKNAVFGLLSGFSVVIQLFTIIFAWLPVEFVSVIYIGLILACTLLVIKVLRGG